MTVEATPFESTIERLGDLVASSTSETIDPWIEVTAENLLAAMTTLRDELGFDMLNDLTAVDYKEADAKLIKKFPFEEHLEVVYHVTCRERHERLKVKLLLPRWKDDVEGQLPEVPSVASVWAAANWHERECFDLCGVFFTDHPKLDRMLCPDDWVGHPLRKDYEMPLEYEGIRGK